MFESEYRLPNSIVLELSHSAITRNLAVFPATLSVMERLAISRQINPESGKNGLSMHPNGAKL